MLITHFSFIQTQYKKPILLPIFSNNKKKKNSILQFLSIFHQEASSYSCGATK